MTDKRDVYVQKLIAKIDEWNAGIEKLEAKSDRAEAEMKIKYRQELEELRAKQRDLEAQIISLQNAGESACEDFKQGIESSWKTLKDGFIRAKSEFERGYKEGEEE